MLTDSVSQLEHSILGHSEDSSSLSLSLLVVSTRAASSKFSMFQPIIDFVMAKTFNCCAMSNIISSLRK